MQQVFSASLFFSQLNFAQSMPISLSVCSSNTQVKRCLLLLLLLLLNIQIYTKHLQVGTVVACSLLLLLLFANYKLCVNSAACLLPPAPCSASSCCCPRGAWPGT